MSYRLLCPVAFGTDVAESVMADVPRVAGLPGHPHAEGGFLVDPHVPHGEARSWRRREEVASLKLMQQIHVCECSALERLLGKCKYQHK